MFEMQLIPHCKDFIEFKGWNTPSPLTGTAQATINLQRSGQLYFQTRNKTLCPITSYFGSVYPNTVGKEYFVVQENTGQVSVKVTNITFKFNLTACARNAKINDNFQCFKKSDLLQTVQEIDFMDFIQANVSMNDSENKAITELETDTHAQIDSSNN